MAQDYEEKRMFVRMQVETQVNFTVNGRRDVTHHGVSQDLSATGLLLQSDFAPDVGDDINIVMNTDNQRLPPFVAQGKVIRVEAEPTRPGQFQISIKLMSSE